MTADMIEQQRVATVRAYITEQVGPPPEETSPQATDIVDTFGKLCALQDINIEDVTPLDRTDIADEARSFVSILYNLGYSATHEGVPKAKSTFTFGSNQLRAKLRDHYASRDLDATDVVCSERQLALERKYIRVARLNEVYFPEVLIAHELTRSLMERDLPLAAWSVRDLIISMGMAIDDILQRQAQLRQAAAEIAATATVEHDGV